MARSRRKNVPRGTMRRKRRGDWVYRDDGMQFAPFTADGLGTYTPNASTITAPDTAGLILYDSQSYMRKLTHGGAGAVGALNQAARAEGRRAACYAAGGILDIVTSDWTVNSNLELGWRIGVFAQNPDDGTIEVDASYSMWRNIGETSTALWANQRRLNLREGRIIRAFNDGQNTGGRFTQNVWWSSRRGVRLEPHECLALYVELSDNSINCRFFTWMRSYVSDEG